MKKFMTLTASLMATGLVSTAAENLLFNSSFELGDKGYSVTRFFNRDVSSDYGGKAYSVDSKTAKHGFRSLMLEATPTQCFKLTSSEVKLSHGKTHTFSFWGKSDSDKFILNASFISHAADGRTAIYEGKGSMRAVLGKEWKQFTRTFKAGDAPFDYYFLMIEPPDDKGVWQPGTCWLDALQLKEGDATEYHPAAAVEVATYAPEDIVGGDKVEGTLRAISYDKTEKNREVKVKLVDQDLREQVAEQVFNLDMPAGETVEREFSLPGLRYGASMIAPELDGESAAGSSFLVSVHPVGQGEKEGFKVGSNGVLLGSSMGNLFLDTLGGDQARIFRLARLTGGMFRVWGGASQWNLLEPEKGKFDWRLSDKIVERAEENGLELLLETGGDFTYYDKSSLPDWVRKKDRGNPDGTLLPPSAGKYNHKCSLPRLEDWRGFVKAIVSRYKGRINRYEILNEPNVSLSAEYYLEYLRSAYEEVKKADPSAQVAGVCATEDLNCNATDFISRSLALGAGNYLDAVTFHPYGARMDDSAITAMQRIQQIKKIMADAGVDKPLWNSESFYLNSAPTGHHVLEARLPLGAISRRLIIDMGEGLPVSTPLDFSQLFRNTGRPHILWFWREQRQPSEIFAEQNAAATFLSGAVPLRTLELPGDIQCYLFKNGDKLYAALWTRSQEKLFMTLKAPDSDSSKFLAFLWPWASDKANISVYDLFGNQTQEDAPEVQLEIGRLPQYLEWNGCDAEAAAKAIESAPIRFENAFKVNLARVFGGKVAVSFTNTSVDTVDSAKVEVESPSFESPGTAQAAKPVASLKTAVVDVPVKLKPDAPETVDLKIRVSGAGKSVEREMSAHVATVIDLMEGRSAAALPIAKTVVGKAASAADLSASFTAAYDAAGDLLLNVQVQDDAKGKPASSPFEEDCIEIFLDAFPLRTETQPYAYQDSTYQITVAPWREKGKQVSGKIANVTAAIKPRPDGYDAEIRVPLRGIVGPLSGKMIGFDIAIDDSDTDKRKTQLVWNGTGSNYKDRSLFGALKFQTTSKARIDIDGQSPQIDMRCGDSSRNVKLSAAEWLGDAKASRLIATAPVYPEWAENSFSFTPRQTGTLRLELMGEYATDTKDRAWCEYDALVVTGAMLLDGEKLGKSPVKVNHDSRFVQKLAVEAGKPVKISFAARAAESPKNKGSRP